MAYIAINQSLELLELLELLESSVIGKQNTLVGLFLVTSTVATTSQLISINNDDGYLTY